MEQLTRADRLRKVARKRWGDRWTLRTQEYSDASTDHVIFHSRGRVTVDGESLLERDRLELDGDGNVVHTRERVQKEKRIEHELVDGDVSS
jgi:hypothetical protein